MSNLCSDPKGGTGTIKRKPPSWMSSKEKGSTSSRKKLGDEGEEATHLAKGKGNNRPTEMAQNSSGFSKLMEGVVFVLSGFVNPERSTLRSQALDMGAEYCPDWSSDCTLLICAFPNTPKFRQVEADCGTIVSKEWVSECYSQKKLVDIEQFLMHAGKPWRKNSSQLEIKEGQECSLHEEPSKQTRKMVPEKQTGHGAAKEGLSNPVTNDFSSSKIKEWAVKDLQKTVSWLESQEEKPEASEVKAIAAEGIMTCLQDVLESLKQKKDIQVVMEQWMCVPHVVKELADFEVGQNKNGSLPKEDLFELATRCKDVYKSEFDELDTYAVDNKRQKGGNNNEKRDGGILKDYDDAGYDSDRTVEMTEEEIEVSCEQMNF